MVIKIRRDADPSEVIEEFIAVLMPLGILVTVEYGEDEATVTIIKENEK